MKKSLYEMAQEKEKIRSQKELTSIINIDTLDADKLWEITNENFYEWTKKHYYPKLLQHFRDNFVKFDEWQRTWFLNDDKLIKLGITECLEQKKNNKNPYKYILEKKNRDRSFEFVSDINLHGKIEHGGPYWFCRTCEVQFKK